MFKNKDTNHNMICLDHTQRSCIKHVKVKAKKESVKKYKRKR